MPHQAADGIDGKAWPFIVAFWLRLRGACRMASGITGHRKRIHRPMRLHGLLDASGSPFANEASGSWSDSEIPLLGMPTALSKIGLWAA